MTQHDSPLPLPRSAPEAQGVSSRALLAFVIEADETLRDLHSLMLLRHGQVVAEGWWAPYGPESPHMLYSLSKSFTSTAAGLAIAEGRLSLDDTVLSFFPEDAPADVSANLAAMRLRHLLSMSTGNDQDTLGALRADPNGNWVRAFLACPVEHEPGTRFVYNSGATYMVAAILNKVTGITLLDYLTPRLLEPLGIRGATWESCPRGINVGGWGLNIKTEDIARFGQLYLQRGVWNGQRLLPESWVEEATARQVSNGASPESDWNQGYGYQFWRSRYGAYRGDGAFGQFCIVMPEQDAVLALTAGIGDMQAELNVVWKHILPALESGALPVDDASCEELNRKLAGLTLRAPHGQSASPLSDAVSGKTYRFETNDQKIETIAFDFDAEDVILHIQDASGTHRIACGRDGAWIKGTTGFESAVSRPVAASGAWTAPDTYAAELSYYETPYCPTLTFQFVEDRVLFNYRFNVAFGPTERPQLIGHSE